MRPARASCQGAVRHACSQPAAQVRASDKMARSVRTSIPSPWKRRCVMPENLFLPEKKWAEAAAAFSRPHLRRLPPTQRENLAGTLGPRPEGRRNKDAPPSQESSFRAIPSYGLVKPKQRDWLTSRAGAGTGRRLQKDHPRA